MDKRTNVSTGTPWEKRVGYSRAVRIGNQVYVAGTISTDNDGNIVGAGSAYEQRLETVFVSELTIRSKRI